MTREDENKAIVRELTEAINRHDVEAAVALHGPAYRDHTPHHEPGREPLRRAYTQMFGAFPDLQYEDRDLVAEGDKVVARFWSTGTHQGPLMGAEPTGRQVTITGIHILRIQDGKIVERWGQVDDLGMMQQLGLQPQHHSHG